MKVIQSILVAGMALGVAAPSFAGRDLTDQIAQQRAVKKLQAEEAAAAAKKPQQGQLASQEQAAPRKSPVASCNAGHPSERVRRC